jgi:hypothetical protein
MNRTVRAYPAFSEFYGMERDDESMTIRPLPKRHWRSYGDAPLPTAAEALAGPFSAFPSWFLRITCDRCGKATMLNEAHTKGKRREMTLRELLARMRHEGCGGLAGEAELLTGIEGVSPRVRRIVLITNPMLRPAPIRRR